MDVAGDLTSEMAGDLSSASLVDPLWALLAVQDLTCVIHDIFIRASTCLCKCTFMCACT